MRKILWLLVLIFACEGPMGPEGPQGEQGEQGEQGSEGTANISVIQFSFNTSAFTVDGNYTYYLKDIPEITSSVFNDGLVLVYIISNNGNAWYALPTIWSYDFDEDGQVDWVIELSYAYGAGWLEIAYFATEGTTMAESSYLLGPFKVVIIPPASLAKYLASNSIL